MPAFTSTTLNPIVCLSESLQEWEIIRECYVKSFFNYPLYKYIEPDTTKREQFLRAYMNAIYEVSIGSGEGIVLAVRIPSGEEKKGMKTVGGALLMPPSCDGCGWSAESDEPYWQAYQKHGLDKISKEGLERVKRYEAWENENIAQKASASRMPLWNGLFCAIEPEYTSRGLGTAVYQKGVKIMAKHWFKLLEKKRKSEEKKDLKNIPLISDDKEPLKKLLRTFSYYQKQHHHRFELSKSYSQDALFEMKTKRNAPEGLKNNFADEIAKTENEIPLAVVITHCERAAHFHCSNGFHPISTIPFHDPIEGVTPFATRLLVLDPFGTGKIQNFVKQIDCSKCSQTVVDQLLKNKTESVALRSGV